MIAAFGLPKRYPHDVNPFSPERQSARMSKIKKFGLDQYGAEHFEVQPFDTLGLKGLSHETKMLLQT